MNPGYSGRSELPENLTSLFRGVAMSVPNSLLIAQVMLFSQGFRSAESLALKVIPFFDICKEQLSVQQHYDFGLRAIKSVLVSAGRLQRENILLVTEAAYDVVELHESQEEAVLVQSIKESVFPKLTQDDCPSGSGKTAGWKALLDALDRLEGRESEVYLIDPKAITKDNLYGWLDPTTREWTDGIFTRILRTIVEDTRGESAKRHWITFDGDIDPEWVENLNSVLDDNKMLTLPNGERLSFPENVRIIFEVENVDQATPATISRCGMILFPDGLVSIQMLCTKYLKTLKKIPVDEMPDVKNVDLLETKYSDVSPCQIQIVELLSKYFTPNGFIENCVNFSIKLDHIMDFRIPQVLDNLFSLVTSTIKKVLEYYVTHPDILLPLENLESFVLKSFFIHTAWSLGGGLKLEQRKLLSQCMAKQLGADFLDDTVFDLDTELLTTTWIPWKSVVPSIDIEPHNIARHDIVIPTLDTLRHEKIIYSWLAEHRSVILCGPPGSGKTMTLFASLRKLPETDVVPINFSSETTSDVLIRTLELHGQYKRSSKGEIFSPKSPGRWLVLFCDEINLPKTDKYGTQRVISFIRQLIEQQGFWRRDRVWVKVERLQIIGACNPPTDQGRVLLTNRFLRHCPVILVDYPVSESLTTIYSTFCRAALKPHPSLRGYYEALTSAMINLYSECKSNFTLDNQLHYIFSPRELTRWIRGIYEITKPMDFLTLGDLIRIWAHEGLRLFQDRLVHASERDWMLNKLNEVAMNQFPGLDFEQVLKGPILFSNFLSNGYESTDEESLTEFISARLQVFYEEESDIPIVLFNSAVNHILRIDRVFRQSQGHLLLIGISGSGKSTLTRFVAWMNGISVYQPSMHSNYSSADFDDDLRVILRRSGYQGEKICFILDQSNILETTFLERINTLLANSEIPGLFEGDDFSSLMSSCKEASQREGFMFETHEELYKWFTTQVARNLHVVFTMNPPNGTTNTSTTSPALFNRCVLNWMGDWDYQAFYQVANEYTSLIDLDNAEFKCPSTFQPIFESLEHPLSYRDIVLDFFIYCHRTTCDLTETLKKQFRIAFITPRQFIDFVALFTKIYQEKRSEVEERQKHLIVGLERLRETFEKVEELKSSLDFKNTELESKSAQANAKLKKMVDDQQQAENSRAASVSMQQALSQKNIQIAKRKDEVLVELALAEPAVIEAQQSVSSIKRQHLTEVRAMGNPPSVIKLAMESVCILLGYKVESWKNVQVILRRDDFISRYLNCSAKSSIVNYDTSSLTQRLRDEISSNYLNDPSYTFETIDRASKACGPLAKWVMAQVQYSAILERVGPLRDEVKQLEESAFDTEKKATETNKMIDELEERISIYKEEYAALISEVQTLKTEMEAVKVRVSRSMQVLDNLSSEKSRWSESKESFAAQMDTLVGDVLLASAFTAYVGYFDQNNRQNLLNLWKNRLEESKISYQKKLSLPEYLSSAEERSQWVNNHLPDDKLCIENAVMISKKQRYPLLIDPAGQALSFLQSFYKSRSIVTTSFRDISFLKSLESALRFGNPIIIQDVEDYNPILNTVLNKELKRSGGRNLIKLGKKEIDFSSSFELFLFTKNPNLAFTPDISSRVTFINFTITPASLTVQCLDKFLKVDRPDIDKKRKDLLKLQGEFQLRLHFLERALLNSLNETDGNIMDDENAMRTLEVLKEEATEILLKVAETDKILVEVDTVTDLYQPLAQKSSAIYFCIEQLEKLELFYQFSLEYYFQLFEKVLDLKQSSNRIADLENYLFLEIYEKISVSLRQEDLMVFALLLAQIKAENGDTVGEWTFLFQSHVSISDRGNDWAGLKKILDSKNVDAIYRLSKLKSFSTLVDEIVAQPQIFRKFINSDETSTLFSELSSISSINFQKPINRLLLLNCIYTSDVTKILLPFLKDVLGDSFSLHPLDNKLSESISTDFEAFRPIILCSDKGYDVSRRVETLSASLSKTILAVAMGSSEGVQQADSAIAQGIRTGCWVLIKNAHLDIPWLVALEKRLLTIKSTTFKLFITVEIHPRIPVNLLRACKILTFEPPVGIRSSVLESVRLVPKIPSMLQPVEKGRVLFMLAWLHGIIIERTRYLPIGWTKKYDFNDSDFELAAALINVWFDRVSQNKSNIDPKNIPWNALTSLISQTVYGGKINSLVDQRLLEHLVSSAFHPGIYDIDFALAKNPDESLLILPDVIGMEKFAGWVSTLPENQPPTWIGLASTSDDLLTSINSSSLFKKLRKFVDGSQDSSTLVETEWTNVIKKQIAEWENALPNDMKWEFEPNSPMEKFFHGEFRKGKTVVSKILLDLKLLNSILDGLQGHTNYSRLLLSQIRAGITPSKWITYTVPTNITCGVFIADLSLRLNFILKVSEATDFQKVPVWLGGLFDPQAFFTATRQTTAKLTTSSLESLKMSAVLGEPPKNVHGFKLTGLKLYGANITSGSLKATDEAKEVGIPLSFFWTSNQDKNSGVDVPVYINYTRSHVLFHVNLDTDKKEEVIKRSVAIIA
ncbi:hypothetical protein HDV02_006191 [Globomyces sp. JEL0801]|nr:hypothetical protein HDV02_006191 [Globomyces sp. JEL0801]